MKPKEIQQKEAQFELIEEDDDMPPDSEAPVFEDAVLAEELLGIKVLSNAADIRPYGSPVTGLDVDPSLPLANDPRFRAALDPYFSQPLTLTTTFEIRRDLADFYRKHDYPVTRIIVPEQDITSGTLQVVVLIGKRGNITVEGNKYFSAKPFRNTIRLRMGEPIQARQLLSDLEWMNQNPFRSASLVYGKGDAEGMTDIHLRVQDRFPVRVFAGYENTGNDITGDERWFIGGNWGNAFNLDHQFSYQFSTSSDFELSRSHAASYLIPLPWRHTLNIYGSITETNADLPAPLDQEGTSWQTSAIYDMPLPPLEKLKHSFFLGFDFKQTDSVIDTLGVPTNVTLTDVLQFSMGYQLNYPDPWGNTYLGGTFYIAPGDWTDNSRTPKYQASRAGSQTEYHYTRLNLTRSTTLPWDFTWILRGQAQFASDNLLASEQLGLGGTYTVRGYEEREVNGDEGYFFSTELRTASFRPLQWVGVKKIEDNLQLLGFWDWGQVSNIALLAGEDAHAIVSSVGVGARYTINPYLSFRFDYGWQLTDSGMSDRGESGRGHMGLTLSY
ncbi:MAG: ShlB/FhaC/HecB family hemolysin secretion/activation protein [Verrucomicrobiota bacterium]